MNLQVIVHGCIVSMAMVPQVEEEGDYFTGVEGKVLQLLWGTHTFSKTGAMVCRSARFIIKIWAHIHRHGRGQYPYHCGVHYFVCPQEWILG